MQQGSQGNTREAALLKHTVDVVLWAIAQHQPITPQRIQDRWGVHRATAYRWWHHLEEARVRAQNMTLPRQDDYRRPVLPDHQPELRA